MMLLPKLLISSKKKNLKRRCLPHALGPNINFGYRGPTSPRPKVTFPSKSFIFYGKVPSINSIFFFRVLLSTFFRRLYSESFLYFEVPHSVALRAFLLLHVVSYSTRKTMAPKSSKTPKTSKPIDPVISPKIYLTSAPSMSEIACDYLFSEDIPIHAIEEIHSALSPNTIHLLLPQIVVTHFPLNPFFNLFFRLLKTWPFTIHPNIFCIISCAILMRAVEALDIRPEDLLYFYRVKHRKGGCFDFVIKYFTVNSLVEPTS